MVFRQRNSQRFPMDMPNTDVKRNASASPQSALHSNAPSPSTPPNTAQDPNGSEILVRCLQAENVKYVWGYPGGAVLYLSLIHI